MTYYILYTDRGPKGACGQDCHTTSSWAEIHMFPSLQAAQAGVGELNQRSSARKQVRIELIDAKNYGGLYDHRPARAANAGSFEAGMEAAIAIIRRRYMGDNNREDLEVKRCLTDLEDARSQADV